MSKYSSIDTCFDDQDALVEALKADGFQPRLATDQVTGDPLTGYQGTNAKTAPTSSFPVSRSAARPTTSASAGGRTAPSAPLSPSLTRAAAATTSGWARSARGSSRLGEHTSELQSRQYLVCR